MMLRLIANDLMLLLQEAVGNGRKNHAPPTVSLLLRAGRHCTK